MTAFSDETVLKRNEVLSFDDGLLTIKISGHGAGDGWGSIAFHERQIEIDADGFHVAEIPPSELRALRDFLNRIIPAALSASPVAQEPVGAEIARELRRYLDKLEYQPTGRDPKNTGFSFAKIPDWQLRQWIEKIDRKPLGEVLINCLKKIGVDE